MGQENWYLKVEFDGHSPSFTEEIPLRGAATQKDAVSVAEGELMEAKKRHKGRIVKHATVVSWPSAITMEL